MFSWHHAKAQELFNEAAYTPRQTTFTLNAPTHKGAKQSVKLRIYAEGTGGKPVQTITMKPVADNRWQTVVKGNLKGRFYTFDISRGETPGVFAKAVGVNGQRAAVVDLRETNPEGWEHDTVAPFESPADWVVYELHHRDFSIHPASGFRHKGKYLALSEPQAIAYLKELGINAVHILPSFDFATIDETRLQDPQYNWGYDPLNYNVPDGSYSTDPYNPLTRIREFKTMVQALHKAGIKVILDVVYNHTNNIEGSNFQRTFPDYYYRKNADGTYSDGSGCGNETASERPLMRRFMLESVRYWAKEYHIDGFRFDLMGMHDIETMNLIREELNRIRPGIFVYGEGWSAGRCAYPADKLAMKANVAQLKGIAAFSDELRDALRGPFSDDTKAGFLGGVAGNEESIKFGIAGAVAHPQVDMAKVNYSAAPWAAEPTQMISYVSCHDDMCLTDRLRASVPGIETQEIIRLDLLAQTAVLTSQGVPFLLSGEEMFRNKKGVHNSYCSPDSINQLDWQNLHRFPQVYTYYRNLIALRKAHRAFRLGTAERVRACLSFLDAPSLMVAYRLDGGQTSDDWKTIYVFLNAAKQAQTMALPMANYTVVCREGVIKQEGIETLRTDKVQVPPQSALILYTND